MRLHTTICHVLPVWHHVFPTSCADCNPFRLHGHTSIWSRTRLLLAHCPSWAIRNRAITRSRWQTRGCSGHWAAAKTRIIISDCVHTPYCLMPIADHHLPQYAPLVRKLALQLLARLPASVALDDLIQAGLMGLLDAMRRYEATADAQFETYATARIRGAMMDELRSQDWLPRSVRSKARQIERAVSQLEQHLLRAPTDAEVAAELGVPLAEYHALLYDARGVQIVHAEDMAHDDGDSESGLYRHAGMDSGHSTACPGTDPVTALLTSDLRRILIEALDALPEREQLLLSLCFEQGLNLKEVGAVLGVTEARVCQLRAQATLRIRAYLAEHSWQGLPRDLDLAQVMG